MKSIMNSCAAGTTELDFCLFYLHVLTSTFNHLQPHLLLTSPPPYPHESSIVTSTLVSYHLISSYQVWGSNGVRRTACCFLSHHRCLVSRSIFVINYFNYPPFLTIFLFTLMNMISVSTFPFLSPILSVCPSLYVPFSISLSLSPLLSLPPTHSLLSPVCLPLSLSLSLCLSLSLSLSLPPFRLSSLLSP